MIFRPWVERIEQAGGAVLTHRTGHDLTFDSTRRHCAVCGDEVFDADAVIFAVGVSGMQKIVSSSPVCSHGQFRTSAIWGSGCTCIRLWFDQIAIPRPSNVWSDATTGWTFLVPQCMMSVPQ